MADKWGQFDNELSGGSDTWDNGLAGSILLADYFTVPAGESLTGTLAAAETGGDAANFTGFVASASIAGAMAATETGTDSAAIAGSVAVQGSLGAIEIGGDSFTAAGTIAIAGAMAAIEAGADLFFATGLIGDGPSAGGGRANFGITGPVVTGGMMCR